MRRAKIVCTLGPATSTPEQVLALVEAGMDVARLNFSHGDHADHAARYQLVRTAAAAQGKNVPSLAALQGPKIRLGRFAGDGRTVWETGETVRITVDDVVGTHDRVSTTYKQLAQRVGNPAAIRAVGTACATNPLPVVVPCHRVLRTDGTLGGYLGGLEVKSALLALESAA